jgi:hypothetical protein
VIGIELAPQVGDEPLQGGAGVVDQWHHPLPRPGAAGAVASPHVEFPEVPPLSFAFGQIQRARLIHPQPHLGHQPGSRVVAGRRRELTAAGQLVSPAGEQGADLGPAGRDPQRRLTAFPAGPVDLIDRAPATCSVI